MVLENLFQNGVNKIYIIGPVGSGKTTLSRKISEETKIPCYELDLFVWKDTGKGNVKRTYEETHEIFKDVLKQDTWIFEDVGRTRFEEARKQADLVIYLDTNKHVINKRIFTRWLKQIFKKEECKYKPTLKILFLMYKWHHGDQKRKKQLIKCLQEQAKKLVVLKNNNIFCYTLEANNKPNTLHNS